MKKEILKDPKRRKILLVLPLIAIPFITMAFWALGGGNVKPANGQKSSGGLNFQLPNAQLQDDKDDNKLTYYERAEKDAKKWQEGAKNDPFFAQEVNDSLSKSQVRDDQYALQTGDHKDPNEQKVYQKLAELNEHLRSPESYSSNPDRLIMQPPSDAHSFDKEAVDRLEQMIKTASVTSTKDPELDQLNTMMNRILDIQHPERIKQNPEDTPRQKQDLFPVTKSQTSFSVGLLDTLGAGDEPNAFFGVDKKTEEGAQNAVEAVIHESQTLVNGSIVKMRLLNDIKVDHSFVPKGNLVFGSALLQGERLHIEINSIRNGSSIYPVRLVAYDLDGMEGIQVPGAISRDVVKQSAQNSLQNIEMGTLDPSLKGQAASAGINAARSLLTKKVKLVRVRVQAGYQILIKEKNSQ